MKPQILIASPQLLDPNFYRAVLLLVDHSISGAMGFVINKPGTFRVEEMVLRDDKNLRLSIPAWYGGPVDPESGLILSPHSFSDAASSQTEVKLSDGVFLSSSQDCLQILAQDHVSALHQDQKLLHPYRFLVGYAGWTAGQLDAELRFGSWLMLPINLDLLFNTSWETLWEAAMQVLGVRVEDFAPSVGSDIRWVN